MNLEERIKNGWEISAEGYSKRIVKNDFVLPGRAVWTDLILSVAPRKGKLKILDVGTGPGVFATILSLAGHDVTGIDISPKMLEQAKANAAEYGVSPEFLLMNSQNISFQDDTFDMIVSRYVVWAMEYPERAYKNWLHALKPGGRVVVFDGGHSKRKADEVSTYPDEATRKAYRKKFGEEIPMSYTNYEEARGWKRELQLTYVARPDWDISMMSQLGYTNIHWDDVGDTAKYTEQQKFLNDKELFFRLCGDKAK
jgi:SAM-dependent methyltransferase